jgi:hypothetical protein
VRAGFSTLNPITKERKMKRSTMVRMGAVGVVCAIAGGAAGIAGSSASSSSTSKPAPDGAVIGAGGPMLPPGGPMLGFKLGLDAAGPPVHSDSVVPNQKGSFDTITMDRGTFSSLSGDQLTITEGTKTATYKTVTLTIPANATVRRNDETAHLSDIKSGDTVMVAQSPQGTFVDARDAQHAEMHLEFRSFRHGDLPDPRKLAPAPKEGASGHPGDGQVVVPQGTAY